MLHFGRMSQTKDKPRVFVLMPFADELTAIYESGLLPMLSDLGYQVDRGDDLGDHQSIIKDIVEGIDRAIRVIADLTGRNSNVMYEVVVAHSRNRATVLMTQHIDDIPFDLRAYRAVK